MGEAKVDWGPLYKREENHDERDKAFKAKKIQLPRKTRQLPQTGEITGLILVCSSAGVRARDFSSIVPPSLVKRNQAPAATSPTNFPYASCNPLRYRSNLIYPYFIFLTKVLIIYEITKRDLP